MRILGIDYGDRKIGLAISDQLGITAQPLISYRRKTEKEDAAYFKRVVSEYEIKEVIVGLPLRMDGSSGTRAEKTQEFARWLEQILGLPVNFWDERLTTKQASKILSQQKISPKAKKNIEDQVSAVIILSTYLESKRAG
ncbi:MAG: Holliday junction resolvase RuvX [Candidatus Aminicenantes bacterium]|nr:MAG: Holliday junction resolvase RuvX [Candidatus Aminicenantes bacterium]